MEKFRPVLSLLICSIALNTTLSNMFEKETGNPKLLDMFEKETGNPKLLDMFGKEPDKTTVLNMFENETDTMAFFNTNTNNTTLVNTIKKKTDNIIVSDMFEKEADTTTVFNMFEKEPDPTTVFNMFEKEADTTTVFNIVEKEADTTTVFTMFDKEADTTTVFNMFEKETDNITVFNMFEKEADTTTVFNMFDKEADTTTVFNMFEKETDNITVFNMFEKEADNTTVFNMFEKEAVNTTVFNIFEKQTDSTISFKHETFTYPSNDSIRAISEYGNKTTCEFQNMKEILKASTRGVVYPLHKSKASILIHFNDSNFIVIEISSNCSHSLQTLKHFFFRVVSVQDMQDLFRNCTSVLFQKLFCDPEITYNIHYKTSRVFSYFSDVGIYFTDKSSYCTIRFKQLVEKKHGLLQNNDINFFLKNLTVCWKFLYFTNQVNIKLPLGSFTSDKNHFFKGVVLSSYSSKSQLYFATKQASCFNQFRSNLYPDGSNEIAVDTEYIWYDSIIEFTSKTVCLEVTAECRSGFNTMYSIPNRIIAYSQLALASEVMVVNSIALVVFLQKDNRSPVTIILSALSVSDTLGSILMSVPTFIAHQQDYHNFDYSETLASFYIFDYSEPLASFYIFDYSQSLASFYIFDYPKCVVYCTAIELKFCFHFVSVLLTTAMLFPIWSNRYLHNKLSILSCLLVVMVSMALFSPIIYFASMIENVNGTCCGFVNHANTYLYMHIAFNMCICIACAVVFTCTIYIACKLTIVRRHLPWTDNAVVQKRNRISSMIVSMICIIFVVSETPHLITVLMVVLEFYDIMYPKAIYELARQYEDLFLIVGFSLNFVVYIVMSKQMRHKVWSNIKQMVICWTHT